MGTRTRSRHSRTRAGRTLGSAGWSLAVWLATTASIATSLLADSIPAPPPVVLDEVAKARNLVFVAQPSRTAFKHQPETMMSGVAVLDYDGDGWLDVYAVNGATMPGLVKAGPEHWGRLFRNDGHGSFVDVTEKAGVQGNSYQMGVVAGDYDNDGDVDLFVAGLRHNTLYRNDGNGRFTDVTAAAGLSHPDPRYGTLWSVAAAFADYDKDGWLDLFVSNYCVWDPALEPRCGSAPTFDYCHPREYQGLPNTLLRNNRDGTFSDVSVSSGIRSHVGKGMGIGVADFDDDGWVDFFVSNDTVPGFLFMNKGNGTFVEEALARGVAYTARAIPVSGMGADAKDIDNDGLPDIFQTALASETFPVYRNTGGGVFEEITVRSGMALHSQARAGWGNAIVDLNNDGLKDLVVACAGVMDPAGPYGERIPMANAVFLNAGSGRFVDGSTAAGTRFARPAVHRGLAVGDLDNDGRQDLVMTALDGALELWHNVSPTPNHWLLVRAIGTKSPRDGHGAKIKIVTAAGPQWGAVNTAVGYGGASDPRVHFGLGAEKVVRELTVRWPAGGVQTLRNIPADQVLVVTEP